MMQWTNLSTEDARALDTVIRSLSQRNPEHGRQVQRLVQQRVQGGGAPVADASMVQSVIEQVARSVTSDAEDAKSKACEALIKKASKSVVVVPACEQFGFNAAVSKDDYKGMLATNSINPPVGPTFVPREDPSMICVQKNVADKGNANASKYLTEAAHKFIVKTLANGTNLNLSKRCLAHSKQDECKTDSECIFQDNFCQAKELTSSA